MIGVYMLFSFGYSGTLRFFAYLSKLRNFFPSEFFFAFQCESLTLFLYVGLVDFLYQVLYKLMLRQHTSRDIYIYYGLRCLWYHLNSQNSFVHLIYGEIILFYSLQSLPVGI